MLNYIYLKLVSLGYNWIKKIHYGLTTWKSFLSQGLNYRQRDTMSQERVNSFHSYLYDNVSIPTFLSNLDNEGKNIALKSIENIKFISQNNYCLYDNLYDDRLIKDQKKFAKYVLKNKGKYFPNFDYLYLTNDYYMDTLQELCNGVNGKAILDCGAFIGDTAIPLAHMFIKSQIHAFEPESHNYSKLIDIINYNQKQNQIIPVKLGVGDQYIKTTISNGGAGAKIGEEGEEIEITTIDQYVGEKQLEVGLIKRDIEGFEYESVVGAEQTIKKDKPVLIISLYHRGKDFFEIKKLIEGRNLGYKFTVRKRNCFHPFADTVLICYH
ncbi:MAG TPA: FkbM family methyltransferase [Candidatus Absconditabacterales bacterium]|nr:FkbM family methyltransferase [Candidatus Absconditabacterales bacterium]